MAAIYDHRQISMMINSPHFNYFTFFILKDGDVYKLFEGIPGVTNQIGNKCFQSETDALNAANKIAIQKKVLEYRDDIPIWGPFYHPQKKWLEKRLNGANNGNGRN